MQEPGCTAHPLTVKAKNERQSGLRPWRSSSGAAWTQAADGEQCGDADAGVISQVISQQQ
jgi:hypothetical protein